MKKSKIQKQRLFWIRFTTIFAIIATFGIGITLFVAPDYLSAFGLPIDEIGNPREEVDYSSTTPGAENEGTVQISETLASVITFLKYFCGILALVWATWSGIRLVTAGNNEETAKEAQAGVTYAIMALMIIVLVEPLITNALYGGGQFNPGEQLKCENIGKATDYGKEQIIAVIEWVKAITVFLGVAFLIFSGWRFLQDIGGEEEISKQKYVIMWIAVGLIVMGIDKVLVDQVIYGAIFDSAACKVEYLDQNERVTRGIREFVGIMKYFLQFLAAISVAIMVYAGFLMITSFTSEENIEKGKKILISAGIGFLIILFSYILVYSMGTGSVS